MNLSKTQFPLKQYGIFYLLGFLLLLGIKYFYSQAGSDELIWILSPTTRWVSILCGIPFEYESGVGYVNHNLRYIIAPSCSGVQFMIITMAMLIFSFIHRMGPTNQSMESSNDISQVRCLYKQKKCWGWMVLSIIFSYLLTVFVNGLRIIVAIYLPRILSRTNIYGSLLTPDRLHTIIGTTVYFAALLTIYRLTDSVTLKQHSKWSTCKHQISEFVRRCLTPTFWYFFIVLGIPLLNNANQKRQEQFMEYATLIILVCMIILLLYSPTLHSKRHRS